MPVLREISGPDPGRMCRLDRSKTVLGRHPDCNIVIEVGAVSRHHAQVILIDGQYYIEDLNSRNGTYLNEQLVPERQLLNENDRVRICDVTFSFQWTPSDPKWTGSRSDSSAHAILVDDVEATGSHIMSRLNLTSPVDVTSSDGAVRVTSSSDVKLKALLEITTSLGRAIALDEVLPQVLNSLFKVFTQADRGFIVLRQPDDTLIPRWTKVRREEQEDTLRISRTIVSQVMESREAILSADAASDERFDMSESIADFRIRSMMCVPLINSDDGVIGVLQIDTQNQRHRFQPPDLEVLASVAAQAAIAIDNAQLHEQAMQQRSMQRDLEVARQVQQSFLPQMRPELTEYQFAHFYRPANQIGGDFYDYVTLPDGRVAVIVADVVGHGVAAALLMAKLSSDSRFCLATEGHPAEVIGRLNQKLCEDNLDDRFVTLVLAVIQPTSHRVEVVNAGHMSPILCKQQNDIEEIGASVTGLPLGIAQGIEYGQFELTLDPNQSLLFYTDGLSEALNDAGELYGLHRVRQQVAAGPVDPDSVVNRLVNEVKTFSGQRQPSDDMCLVCLGRH